MKRLIALLLTVIVLILVVGCQETQTRGEKTSPDATDPKPNVMKAWSGEFSEEKLKAVINEYQSDYSNIVLEAGSSFKVSFETDCEVSSCYVSRLSCTDDADIEVELNGYIDLIVDSSWDGRTVTIPVGWWCDRLSWVNNYQVWSYLVRIVDVDGGLHYYYFRVDYSVFAQSYRATSKNVLEASVGDWSKDILRSAINEYRNDYSAIMLEKGGGISVSFETDFDISSCTASLFGTDDSNIENEVNGVLDSVVSLSWDGKTVTIRVDDWLYSSGWVRDHLIWSYVVDASDADGIDHYYYFRVDYSAYAQ